MDERPGRPVDWRLTEGGLELFEEANPDAWVGMKFLAGVAPERRLFAVCPACGFAAPQRVPPGMWIVCGECDAELDGG